MGGRVGGGGGQRLFLLLASLLLCTGRPAWLLAPALAARPDVTQRGAHRVGRGVRIMVSTTRVMTEGLPRMAQVEIMVFWIMAIFSGTCGGGGWVGGGGV